MGHMSVMNSSARPSFVGVALLTLMLIWSLSFLEMPSMRTAIETTKSLTSGIDQHLTEQSENTVDEVAIASPDVADETTTTTENHRPLILYAYSETESARANLKYFIKHGLHAAADFVFIINGESDAKHLIPVADNIRYIERPNDCYDLGAYAEVLTGNELYKKYSKYIMLNASIRGPFLPYWSESCWTDMYLRRVTEEVKLVGMTSNCWPNFHVQSMIWATDRVGIELLLFPSQEVTDKARLHITAPEINDPNEKALSPGLNHCFHTWKSAVQAEIGATSLIKAAGYEVDVMMSAYHKTTDYAAKCDGKKNGDVLWNGKYEGTNVHPFETIFIKANRDIDPVGIQKHTEWMDGREYSSYDFCKAA